MASDSAQAGVIVLTPEQLRTIVQEAVRAEVSRLAGAEELMELDEVADLLNVCAKTVRTLIKKGLPAKRVGGQPRFFRHEVIEWVRTKAA